MKKRSVIMLLAFLFALTPLFFAAATSDGEGNGEDHNMTQENDSGEEGGESDSNDNDKVESVDDLKALVEQLADRDEFENDQAVHALKLHLTAVAHYEKKDKKDKVTKHLNGFKELLDHQRENGKISGDAFSELNESTANLIAWVNALEIVKDGQARAVVVSSDDDVEKDIPEWNVWPANQSDHVERTSGIAHTGNYSASINFDNIDMGRLRQKKIPLEPGPIEFSIYYFTSEKGNSKIKTEIHLMDENYNVLKKITSGKSSTADTAGDWEKITVQGDVPDKVDNTKVTSAYAEIYVYDQDDVPLYVDDAAVYQNDSNDNLLKNSGFEEAKTGGIADTIIDYVQKSTGAELPVTTEENEDQFEDDTKIYIGESAPGQEDAIEEKLNGMDDQGFLIHTHEDTVTIIGPTDVGTQNGVYDFLERYLDIRFLMPGPDGEDVPKLTDVQVPDKDVLEDPDMTYRVISAGLGDTDWVEKNKLQLGSSKTISFSHNLYSLFPVDKYAESHPEFYPDDNPSPDGKREWQPCFTEEGTVDAAVSGIIDYFDENPDETSYALGINDNHNYCEADPDHPDYPDKTNSVGDLDMSDIYYKWVNDVVEQVREEYPDKWFGLLAYNDVTDPPSFKLDDHVVPFITKDRLTWIDDDIEDYGHYQMEEWEKVANNIGWYDYMYGTFYMVPRVFPHKMAETFQYAKEHNVIGDYIEMYHNAGDGPKAWLAAKLMWDSDQDVDALMQEWYERTVGVEAASDLAELYDHWEDFWTNRIKESNWFQNGKTNTYLPFKQQTYLNLVTDGDIEQSMNLISSVVDKAQTDEQKTRAEKIQKMFKYYEATALSYPREGDMEAPKDEAEALELVETIADTLEAKINFASKRAELKEEFEDDPALKFRSSRWYEWSGTNGSEFWNVADYIRDHESDGGAVTDRMNELAGDDQSLNLREFAELVLAVTTGEMRSLTGNPSYEEGEKDAPPWNFWDPSGTATIERVEGTSHTGDSSVLIENATDRSGTHQTFKIQPGKTAAQMHYYTPEGTETDGFVRIVVSPQSEDGETLADYISSEKSLSDSAGEWSSVGVFEDIPTEINGKKVDKVLLNAQVMNAPDTKVYLDDVGLYQSQILTRNSSFEEGDSSADAWNSWIKHSGSIQRVEDKAHSGEASLLVDQLERGGPHQNFNVGSGLKKVQIYYYPVDGTEKGTIQLTLHVRNEDGDELKSLHTEETELFESVEEWASIDFLADIPEKVDGEPVADAKVVAVIDGAEDSQVYLENFEVRNAVNVE